MKTKINVKSMVLALLITVFTLTVYSCNTGKKPTKNKPIGLRRF